MIVTKDLEVYLENGSANDIQVGGGELFGFELGTYSESPLGR